MSAHTPLDRFGYIKYTPETTGMSEAFKALIENLESSLNIVTTGTKRGEALRYKALALTKLEEFYMYVGKTLRELQVEASVEPQEHVPERTDA